MTVVPSEASKVRRHKSEQANIDRADSCSQTATVLGPPLPSSRKGRSSINVM